MQRSTRVDEGRKGCILLTIKMQGAYRSEEGREQPAMWPKRKKGEDDKWEGERRKEKHYATNSYRGRESNYCVRQGVGGVLS